MCLPAPLALLLLHSAYTLLPLVLMTPSSSPHIVPSPAHIALAIVIIRSKPSGTLLREYVLQLREQVKQGRNSMYQQQPVHYLDLVGHWQEQYKKVQEECDQLRSMNIKLERSNQLLATKASLTTESDHILRNSKRRITSKAPSRPCKRTKVTPQKSAEKAVADAQDAIESDYRYLDTLGADGADLTESLFVTHRLCKATDIDPDILCLNLVRISSALGKVIRIVAKKHANLSSQSQKTLAVTSPNQEKLDYAVAMSVCARAFMSILVGTRKLVEACSDNRLTGSIICELVDMFESALNSIELSAQQTAQISFTQPIHQRKRKSKSCTNNLSEAIPACTISHLLNSFLGFLDRTDMVHQNIFEAFVFTLFERVGRRLYYCTFGRRCIGSMEDRIKPVPEPQSTPEMAQRDMEVLAVRLEMKALVIILERVMGLAPNHMNLQTTWAGMNSTHLSRMLSFRTLPPASRARLSPLAKDRLQRTLVACMYGGKADDDFLDILIKPLPPMRSMPSAKTAAKVEDENTEDWFKQEVWRLVGWDILTRESDW